MHLKVQTEYKSSTIIKEKYIIVNKTTHFFRTVCSIFTIYTYASKIIQVFLMFVFFYYLYKSSLFKKNLVVFDYFCDLFNI